LVSNLLKLTFGEVLYACRASRLTIQRRPVRGSIIADCPIVFRHVVEIGSDIGNMYITLQYLSVRSHVHHNPAKYS